VDGRERLCVVSSLRIEVKLNFQSFNTHLWHGRSDRDPRPDTGRSALFRGQKRRSFFLNRPINLATAGLASPSLQFCSPPAHGDATDIFQ
jgi:hypothetical protein